MNQHENDQQQQQQGGNSNGNGLLKRKKNSTEETGSQQSGEEDGESQALLGNAHFTKERKLDDSKGLLGPAPIVNLSSSPLPLIFTGSVKELLDLAHARERDLLKKINDLETQLKQYAPQNRQPLLPLAGGFDGASAPQSALIGPSANPSSAILATPMGVGMGMSVPVSVGVAPTEAKVDRGPLPQNLAAEPPSKVVHFRNVSDDINQAEILGLCIPFGRVVRILRLKDKNQCLIEFRDLHDAMELINYYERVGAPPNIRSRKLYLKFSRFPAITAPNSSVSNILLVTLASVINPEDRGIPLTADVMWQIFSPFGSLTKIVVISKAGSHQALIQFTEQAMCMQVFEYLNGKSVYIGIEPNVVELTLTTQFSHLEELTVHQQSDKSRDYSLAAFGSIGGMGAMPAMMGGGDGAYAASIMQQQHYQQQQQQQQGYNMGGYGGYDQAYYQQQQVQQQQQGYPQGDAAGATGALFTGRS